MKLIESTDLSPELKLAIYRLWNQEYPEKLTYSAITDFENYLQGLSNPTHILLLDEQHIVRGWYADFDRDGERWFVIILDTDIHGRGWGRKMLNLAKTKSQVLNGWVTDHNRDTKRNGDTYISPLDFYMKNGFEKLDDIRLELEHISAVKIQWSKRNST